MANVKLEISERELREEYLKYLKQKGETETLANILKDDSFIVLLEGKHGLVNSEVSIKVR